MIHVLFWLLWPPSRAGHYILLLWFLSSFFLFFSLPVLSGRRLDVYHAYTHDVALVQIWNACLKCAVRGSVTIQDVKIRHLCTITQLCQAISSQLRHALTIRKELVKQQCLLPMSSNIVNFGPLVAEICFRVWGTPANFNGFCILALLFHWRCSAEVNQTLHNFGRLVGCYIIYTFSEALAA